MVEIKLYIKKINRTHIYRLPISTQFSTHLNMIVLNGQSYQQTTKNNIIILRKRFNFYFYFIIIYHAAMELLQDFLKEEIEVKKIVKS